jgi:hypothetical protein
MKKSPQQQKLEELLKSSKFSICGFLGDDTRNLWEIIDEDAADLARMGTTKEAVAARMQELTNLATSGLGDWIRVGKNLEVSIDDNRGMIPCPWPHHVRCLKRITSARQRDTGKTIRWSDMNIHLVKEHGFFEGRGSPFRIEPRELFTIIFSE